MSRIRKLGKWHLTIAEANRANDCDPGMIGFTALRMLLLFVYVDPGSAGFIVTTVLGVLAAGGYIARSYLNRLNQWVFRRNRKTRREEVPSSADGQGNDR